MNLYAVLDVILSQMWNRPRITAVHLWQSISCLLVWKTTITEAFRTKGDRDSVPVHTLCGVGKLYVFY